MEQGKLYNFNSYSKTFYDGDDDALVMAIVNGKETPFIWAEDGLLKSKGVGILRRDSGEFVMPVFGAEKTDNGYVNMPDMPVIWDERGNCRASFHYGEYHAELFISDKENPRCFWSDSAAEGLYPCILSGVFSIGMLGRHYDRAKKTVTAMQIHPAGYPVVVHIEPCRLDIRWLVFMDRAAVSDIPSTPQDINKAVDLLNGEESTAEDASKPAVSEKQDNPKPQSAITREKNYILRMLYAISQMDRLDITSPNAVSKIARKMQILGITPEGVDQTETIGKRIKEVIELMGQKKS